MHQTPSPIITLLTDLMDNFGVWGQLFCAGQSIFQFAGPVLSLTLFVCLSEPSFLQASPGRANLRNQLQSESGPKECGICFCNKAIGAEVWSLA